MSASKSGTGSNALAFRGPVDARWLPSGVFEHASGPAGVREVPLQEIVEAARLLVGVSRLSGYSVQGLIALALTAVPPVAAGEDLIGDGSAR